MALHCFTAPLDCVDGIEVVNGGGLSRRGESKSPPEPSVRENYSGAQHTNTNGLKEKLHLHFLPVHFNLTRNNPPVRLPLHPSVTQRQLHPRTPLPRPFGTQWPRCLALTYRRTFAHSVTHAVSLMSFPECERQTEER